MKIVIAGGTGFVGQKLTHTLGQEGHEIIVLTRNVTRRTASFPNVRYASWSFEELREVLEGADTVVNLAGESIFGMRWTRDKKKRIIESRLLIVRTLRGVMTKLENPPGLVLNASAIGFYGDGGDEPKHEGSGSGTGFLAEVCRQWEEEAFRLEESGIRTIGIRIGIVLDKDGGMLSRMKIPFSLGLGGYFGSGNQWISWIHREDLVNLIIHLVKCSDLRGVVNATAPHPVRMKEFVRLLGKVMRRPVFFNVPAFLVKLLLGEMSQILLEGQYAPPQRAICSGFNFKFPALEAALKDIFKKK